jgi:alpha-1,3-mannosyltransferase
MNPENKSLPRLDCPSVLSSRFSYLREQSPSSARESLPKYLFALDLYQSVSILPTLMGSIVQAIQSLGPENCALSVVEGRSTDGTFEILALLNNTLDDIGLKYFFQTSDIDPRNERIKSLAELRNLALQPYTSQPEHFAKNSTIIFINDIAVCTNDILEMIHQRLHQGADMTCAMDWVYLATDPTFYDVWVARGMTGDTFFNIPEDGNWNSAWNLFWNDHDSRSNLEAGLPFQVFSCWNGIAAFTAQPFLQTKMEFRPANEKECFQGEPEIFCKDMWFHGYGKIAVVPSVNVGYSVEETKKLKDLKGHVSKWASVENDQRRIAWKNEPPALVKCIPAGYDKQIFVPWNEGLAD